MVARIYRLLKAIWGTERLPRWVPGWMRRRIEVNTWYIHELMALAQQEIPAHETVLDAGAGEGRFRSYLDHAQYLALDFAQGDEGWDYSSLDANADLLQLPFQTASIDNIVCTQVLEHVRDPQQVIAEFGRVLRPGGRLFLAAPQSWHQHQQPHDYFRFTSFALRMLFEQAHLQPRFIQPMGGYFWFLSYQLQMMHYWLQASAKGGLQGMVLFIVNLFLRVIFLFMVPLPLFYLDKLDRTKDATLGYICYCVKQEH